MKIIMLEVFNNIFESKQTEMQGLNILTKANIENPQEIISTFTKGDKSKNQKNITNMVYFYVKGGNDINAIIEVFNEYDELENKKRIKNIVLSSNALKIGDQIFTDFLKFSEFIHGEQNKYINKPTGSSVGEFTTEHKKLWSGNNIDIYEGDGVGKCIQYTQSGLTGRKYGFCIGAPNNTMYQSYRDGKHSTFYFIVDKNKFKPQEDGTVNLDDPLHMVVLDATNNGIQLTDANNTTGIIAEFDSNVNGYLAYLKGKGVPIDKLVNRPKTPEEEQEQRILGKLNYDLNWFIKLPIDYKSKYIGRGHQLTNQQFDYLLT